MNFIDHLFRNSHESKKIAIICRSEQISYKKLLKDVSRLSTWIKGQFGEDQKIILISENSPFFIISYLSIIKSGNICVPLNPSIPYTTLNHIVRQCEAKIGFLHLKVASKYQELFVYALNEQFFDELLECNSEWTLDDDFETSRLAAIIFTSGSTALPKGVMISHKNLISNTESIISYMELRKDDRMAVVLPFYYCYGISLLHTHLKVGGSLVLNNTFMMLNTLLSDLKQHECTGFAGVPSHFQIMLRKSRRFKEDKFPALRYVTQAGGKLPNSFIKEFVDSFPEVKFYVMYGQTEATARLSYLPPEMLQKKMGSIGRGIPGVKLEVVNKNGDPVRAGEIGHIVASGENIMVGYFKDSELTAATIKNKKLYTGDIGKSDEDGYIYIVAREKEFLKIGGERVSPKEIEEVIATLPQIVDCSVVGIEDDLTGEAIIAYVVLSEKGTLTDRDIINYCTKNLSSEKVPKYVEFIDEIQVSETGKKIFQRHQPYFYGKEKKGEHAEL